MFFGPDFSLPTRQLLPKIVKIHGHYKDRTKMPAEQYFEALDMLDGMTLQEMEKIKIKRCHPYLAWKIFFMLKERRGET